MRQRKVFTTEPYGGPRSATGAGAHAAVSATFGAHRVSLGQAPARWDQHDSCGPQWPSGYLRGESLARSHADAGVRRDSSGPKSAGVVPRPMARRLTYSETRRLRDARTAVRARLLSTHAPLSCTQRNETIVRHRRLARASGFCSTQGARLASHAQRSETLARRRDPRRHRTCDGPARRPSRSDASHPQRRRLICGETRRKRDVAHPPRLTATGAPLPAPDQCFPILVRAPQVGTRFPCRHRTGLHCRLADVPRPNDPATQRSRDPTIPRPTNPRPNEPATPDIERLPPLPPPC